jgi:hypothetical protein
MKRRHRLVRICIAVLACSGADFAWPRVPIAGDCAEPPQVLFEDLFVAVQSQGLYADGKAFPDAVPLESPATILEAFRRERPPSAAALRQLRSHFKLPEGRRDNESQSASRAHRCSLGRTDAQHTDRGPV